MAEDLTPKRRTWLYWLRTAAACFCLVFCVGLGMLWLQSFLAYGRLDARNVYGFGRFSFTNEEGLLLVFWEPETELHIGPDWNWHLVPSGETNRRLSKLEQEESSGFIGLFVREYKPDMWIVIFPHWMPLLLFAVLTILLKPKPRLKFTVGELLLLTTVVAVVLSLVKALPGVWR